MKRAGGSDVGGGHRAGGGARQYGEGAIIALLLAFNAALGFFQKGRAQARLAVLKSRRALNAAVKRDNAWTTACSGFSSTVPQPRLARKRHPTRCRAP